MNDTSETIRAYVLAEFMPGEPLTACTLETPLRTGGILDSMAVLKLVAFLEKTYGIELEAHETGVEDFDTVADITRLVESKRRLR